MSKKEEFMNKVSELYDDHQALFDEDDQEKIIGRAVLLADKAEKKETDAVISASVLVQVMLDNGVEV